MAASRPLSSAAAQLRSRLPGEAGLLGESGRVPTWIPIGILVALGVWLSSGLQQSVEAAGFATVDLRRSRLDSPPGFRDPRWQDYLALHLASLPPVDSRDHAQVRAVAAEVARLPFVKTVLEPRVLWPDGIEIPMRLRQPAACVRSGADFLAVSEDGVVLPGRWPTPPLVESKFLPVIGPNDGRFDTVHPGEQLRAPVDVDGLAVAISLRACFEPEDFELAGPPLVDASRARETSVEEAGVRIHLGGRRVVRFGRAPNANEPGELPPERKWAHVRRALSMLRPENGARDWSVVDARWDVADVAWRAAPEVDEREPEPAAKKTKTAAPRSP